LTFDSLLSRAELTDKQQGTSSPSGRRGSEKKSSDPQTKLAGTQSGRGTGTHSSRTSLLSHAAAAAASAHKDSIIITQADLENIKSLQFASTNKASTSSSSSAAAATSSSAVPAPVRPASKGKGSTPSSELMASSGSPLTGAASREAVAARARARKEYMLKLEMVRTGNATPHLSQRSAQGQE
jgi:hypothetical protein